MTIDDFYKTIGYACLYKGTAQTVNEIPADELTVSVFREAYPKKLFSDVTASGLKIVNTAPGVYVLKEMKPFPAQIIVMKELDREKMASSSGFLTRIPKKVLPIDDSFQMEKSPEKPIKIQRRDNMYQFSIFTDAGIQPSKDMVLLGIKMEFFSTKVLQEYFFRMIEQGNDLTEEDIMLLDASDSQGAIFEIIPKNSIPSDKTSIDYLRYAILSSLTGDPSELLQKIEEVYASFDYPADMNAFIYYMPESEDLDTKNNQEINSCRDRLINRFHQFLINEKNRLDSTGPQDK